MRKAESVNRKLNGGAVKIINGNKAVKTATENELETNFDISPKGGIVMNLDNDENRRLVELCYRTNKTLVNPLIDWTDDDIWEFSKAENVKQSDLYVQCGGSYKRLGCIGCPMASIAEKEKEFADYPQIKEAYIKAFDRMLKAHPDKFEHKDWVDGESVFKWWIYGDKTKNIDINQITLDDIELED